MRLNETYLNLGYHNAMILQYKDTLQSEGFKVELDKRVPFAKDFFYVDLFASKGEENCLYEFKVIKNGHMQNKKQENPQNMKKNYMEKIIMSNENIDFRDIPEITDFSNAVPNPFIGQFKNGYNIIIERKDHNEIIKIRKMRWRKNP